MEHYVTLFDSFFLPQGMALHQSMERHAGRYTLWILCIDEAVCAALTKLDLPNVHLLQLNQLETPELLKVKPIRSRAEYCWTLTPFAPRFVFEANSNVSRVTYLDADIWFRKNPVQIFNELDASGKSVLITDHSYAPEYDKSATSGQYCVQFMTFTRNRSETVRKWWEERCIEWCFARYEDGKLGDQKYLDDWPIRFESFVHVLTRQEWAQAPWNAIRYPFSQCIFYHFHALRIAEKRTIDFGPGYMLPNTLIENVYKPYIDDLREAIDILNRYQIHVLPQIKKLSTIKKIRRLLSGIYQQLRRFHIINFHKY